MTTIDHAAEARVLEANAWARGGIDGDTLIRRPEERRDIIASAQVHAQLALVEQQRIANEQARIANLIAIMSCEIAEDRSAEFSEATAALYDAGKIRPDIKKGLGL